MRIGNAPVSWGIFEIEGLSGNYPFGHVMDEIAAAGYEGTELGPYGYYPTDPETLGAELAKRRLALASSFVPVDLRRPEDYPAAEAHALKVADLLQARGVRELILADQYRPERAPLAGRVSAADGLSAAEWESVAAGLNRLGGVLAARGMTAVFHHHVATYVESDSEIELLRQRTDPSLLGLCLDTGHAVYGGADPVDLIRRWDDRVRYVHLKDVNPAVLARARQSGLDYANGVREGLFCPLGQGVVDFDGIFRELRRRDYAGWLIVEQDIITDESAQAVPPLDLAKASREFLRRFVG